LAQSLFFNKLEGNANAPCEVVRLY
jgi:hypothetical protein